MKIWHLIILIGCIAAVAESHRNRGRKRTRKFWSRQQRRFRNSYGSVRSSSWGRRNRLSYNYNYNNNVVTYRHADSEVVVCEFENSMVLEMRPCPLGYNCTAGPFRVKFGNETGNYKFCNIPLKEEHVCKLIHKDSGRIVIDRPCPEGNNCSAGPIINANFWSLYDALEMYFCGDSLPPLPTADVYERLLTGKTCSLNGSITSMCNLRKMNHFWFNAHSSCSGITAELETFHGTDTLRFCKDVDDTDFSYIKLWGTPWCKGSKWYSMVNITRKEGDNTIPPDTEPASTTDSPEIPNLPNNSENETQTPANGGESETTNVDTANTNGEGGNTDGNQPDNEETNVDADAGTDNKNGDGTDQNSVNIPSSSIDKINEDGIANIDP